MPSRDAQWIIGTILAAAVALSVQMAGLRTEHAEIRTDMRTEHAEIRTDMRTEHAEIRAEVGEIRTDIRRMDDRLRAVEVEFGKVGQRLATLERLLLPTPNPADN